MRIIIERRGFYIHNDNNVIVFVMFSYGLSTAYDLIIDDIDFREIKSGQYRSVWWGHSYGPQLCFDGAVKLHCHRTSSLFSWMGDQPEIERAC